MTRRNPFNNTHHNNTGSNTLTVQPQGGGAKKAGFPYIVGRDTWSSIAIRDRGSYTLKFWMTTTNPKTNFSRPLGSVGASINTYYHVPNTGNH